MAGVVTVSLFVVVAPDRMTWIWASLLTVVSPAAVTAVIDVPEVPRHDPLVQSVTVPFGSFFFLLEMLQLPPVQEAS